MTRKIFRSTMLVVIIVLLCCLGIVMGFLYSYYDNIQQAQLQDELRLAAIGTQQQGILFLSRVESESFRLTWVAADGMVLYDTHAAPETMENHADRQEIIDALRSGSGSSSRYSNTLTERTLYAAKRLEDGTVLRISVSRATPAALALSMLFPVLLILIIAIALSVLLARRMSRNITNPLNELDLEHPLENDTYEELTPLLNRINQQHSQISSQMQVLRQKADEFEQITASVQEGLIVLDQDRTLLSRNPAAAALFCLDDESIGGDFLSLAQEPQLSIALDAVFSRGHSEAVFTRNVRQYHAILSRIESEGRIIGAVILVFDVTEQFNAERARREFTANVSHELKTPLQSIIGSTELLENGLVMESDIPRFWGYIRKEAARLVSLVEDILHLSQLDEGIALPAEPVDLYALAQDAVAALQPAADNHQVRLQLTGSECIIQGIRGLLYEILYNLCDNAIKYNRPGGSVNITLQQDADCTRLQVSDTGIGIPPEHQGRIFERFYRVDKSHSRQSGGTGLGLSIVKHAVACHNARLELHSVPQQGTTITILF